MITVLTSLALAAGFRADGTGHVDAHPAPPTTGAERWRLPLAAPGNASVVGFGDDVCVTVEPTTLLCVNAATGAPSWSATHDVVDALAADDATRAEISRAALAAEGLEAMRAQIGPMKRRIRSGDDTARAELAGVEAAITESERLLATYGAHLTPRSDPMMGWASSTPVTDGERIWVMFANGVLACHGRDGALLWQRWLGPRTLPMEFFETGLPTASPALAGGVLVVGYDKLLGVDPSTGATAWTGPAWPHYGSPTAAEIEGLPVVLTPAGAVLRAADGAELASGLAHELWFNAPIVDGDVAWWVGGRWFKAGGFRAEARAVRLRREGDGVSATQVSSTPLDSHERFYVGPTIFGEQLVTVDNTGQLFALDRTSGAVNVHRPLGVPGQVWASPIAVHDALWLQSTEGTVVVLDAALQAVGQRLGDGRMLAGLWFDGERAWMRTHAALIAL